MKLKDLKPAEYNPRTITDEQLARLKKALHEFGDLSSIVFNRRTGRLVGGHQRLKCLPPDAVIQKEKLKKPSRSGTVAAGTITIDNEAYTYREVDWDEAKEKAANIAANQHGGEFDDEKLKEILEELSNIEDFDIDLTGFDTSAIDAVLNFESGKIDEQNYAPVFEVAVSCKDEKEQKQIYNQMTKKGYRCRVLTGKTSQAKRQLNNDNHHPKNK